MAFWQRSAFVLAVVSVLAAGGAACNAVLGLDAPRLDPCANTPCVDGTASTLADGTAPSDAAEDASNVDAAPDTGPINGIRCGGGSSPTLGCGTDAPVCCLLLDAGSATYGCDSDASACTGYPILCATNNDCAGSDVCCHYASAIKCEGETVCANNSLVCEPGGPADQCPSGWTCSVAFTNGSYTLPYYGCTP